MSVPEAVARLRAADHRLRALRTRDVVAGLGRLLDEWSDPTSEARRELARALPEATGLSGPTVEAGLDLALSSWNGAALEALLAGEGDGDRPSGWTAVVHGGVIPMPTIVDLLAPLALRTPVLSRPGRYDPFTPRLLVEAIGRHAPELSDAIAVVDVERGDAAGWRDLLTADRVCVTGGDAAVATLRARLGPRTRLIAHPHKLSIAFLGPDTDDFTAAARALAADVALWDQLGCLSPVACWTFGPLDRAHAFAAELANALAAREAEWPRGAVEAHAASLTSHERAAAELRAADGQGVALHAGDAWTVVAEASPEPRPAPLYRFVRVHPVENADATLAATEALAGRVAGIVTEGFEDGDAIAALVEGLGATRVAPFGRLQAPPLDWARDGLGVLSALRDGAA